MKRFLHYPGLPTVLFRHLGSGMSYGAGQEGGGQEEGFVS